MERPLAADVVVLGEVGLTGEVRAVAGLEARLRAAAQLGFRSAVVPKSGAAEMRSMPLSVRGVATVSPALEALLPGPSPPSASPAAPVRPGRGGPPGGAAGGPARRAARRG